VIDDLSLKNDYLNFFFGVDCVIHCAAIAHIQKSEEKRTINIYEKVNVEWTRTIAKFAHRSWSKTFYISKFNRCEWY
jgi:UDP-glucose 4-epimerase